jgi:transposase-like protein
MGMPRFSREDEDRLIAQYLAGASLGRLAQQEGCSPGGIRKVLIRHGIERRTRWVKGPELDEDRLVEGYLSGSSLAQLAQEVGTYPEAVRKVLLRRGVKCRPVGRFRQEDEERIVGQYVAGASLSAIARQEGCTIEGIRKVLMRHRIERRPKGNTARILDETEQKRLLADYEAGLWQAELAEKYGIPQHTVSAYLRAAGVKQRLRGLAAEGYERRGGRVMMGGYVAVLVPRDSPFAPMRRGKMGYVLEHRLVMAEFLGRPLRRSETVHHIDGDKANNAISNLELRHGVHAQGVRLRCACCGSYDIETY